LNNIVIAFPKPEIAANIKKILAQSGYPITAVCTTGAQALQSMNSLQDGILVCGYRFSDMMYEELYEYLPQGFQMLLIASASNVLEKDVENLVCLSLPIKVHDLLQTMEMMEYSITRSRKKRRNQPRVRSEEERQLLEQAKGVLMERNSLSEEEAHRYIQKRSMDNGTSLVETAEMIISLMGDG
jgi:response regulator NasT